MAFRVDNYRHSDKINNSIYVCIILLLNNCSIMCQVYIPLNCSFKISHNNINNFPKSQILQCLSQLVCTHKPLFRQTEEHTAATKRGNNY